MSYDNCDHSKELEILRFKVQVNEEILLAINKVLNQFGKRLDNIELFLLNKRFVLVSDFNESIDRPTG